MQIHFGEELLVSALADSGKHFYLMLFWPLCRTGAAELITTSLSFRAGRRSTLRLVSGALDRLQHVPSQDQIDAQAVPGRDRRGKFLLHEPRRRQIERQRE